jgi:uracil-DNA glycosylase family 4
MAQQGIEKLSEEVIACRRCPRLVLWREYVARERRASFRDEEYWGRPVPGFGDPEAKIVLVGLAPAAHGANRTGRMFTGDRSGEWLYRALWRAGLASEPNSTGPGDGLRLDGAYVTAAVRCAPPKNRPTREEQEACATYLEREIALLGRARVYVALGGIAFESMARLLAIRPRPRFAHGLEVGLADGRCLLASYHPSQQNTFTGRLTEEMLDSVLARAMDIVASADPAMKPTRRTPGV